MRIYKYIYISVYACVYTYTYILCADGGRVSLQGKDTSLKKVGRRRSTPKHHGPEGRNDLQINRKNKFPGGRNVPSEILMEILSNPAIPSPAILLESC